VGTLSSICVFSLPKLSRPAPSPGPGPHGGDGGPRRFLSIQYYIYIYIYIYICFFFEDFNGIWKLKRTQIKSYKKTIALRIRCLQAACNKAEARENPPQWAKDLPWFVVGRLTGDATDKDEDEGEEDEDEEEEDEEEEEEEEDDKDADSDEVETTEWTYGWDPEVKRAYRTCFLQHPERTRLEMAKVPQPPDAAAEDNDPYFATFDDDSTHVAYRFAWKVQVDERIFPSCWIDRAWKHKYIYIERERGRE